MVPTWTEKDLVAEAGTRVTGPDPTAGHCVPV
jgi:hypothetical protein